jgi:hypothetical protein
MSLSQYNNRECINSDECVGLDEDLDCDNIITIVSNDGYKCSIDRTYVLISDFLAGMLEGDTSAGLPGNEILLKKVSASNLQYVNEYMNHHKGIDNDIPNMPLEDTDMEKVLKDKWDSDFLHRLVPITIQNDKENKPDFTILMELLPITNYLGMNTLLHKLCAKLASFIRNKNESDIANILSDYSQNNSNDDSQNDIEIV